MAVPTINKHKGLLPLRHALSGNRADADGPRRARRSTRNGREVAEIGG
jgi:hypothetical protein